jgi:tRNA pseudouridine55 synthase
LEIIILQRIKEIGNNKDGVLVVNKPAGMTSHDLVNIVRKLYDLKKVGHTGTLDPDAEGIMIIALGRATKFIRFFSNTNKTYVAEILFGRETDTYDKSGKIVHEQKPEFTLSSFKSCLSSFLGETMQRPPIYSALKKEGKHYYEYARMGTKIDIPKRPIKIFNIELLRENIPFSATIQVKCSSGTYIRSLCHDIGISLKTYACMGNLKRIAIGDIGMNQSYDIDALRNLNINQRVELLLPVEKFLMSYHFVKSNSQGDHFIQNGSALLQWNAAMPFDSYQDGELLKIYNSQNHFIGIGQFRQSENGIFPVRMV